jgi:putative transcriptional regulator
MPINLMPDVMLAHRKMTHRNLAEPTRIAKQRLSLVKSGKVMRVGFEIRAANCKAPDCRPDELPEYLLEGKG